MKCCLLGHTQLHLCFMSLWADICLFPSVWALKVTALQHSGLKSVNCSKKQVSAPSTDFVFLFSVLALSGRNPAVWTVFELQRLFFFFFCGVIHHGAHFIHVSLFGQSCIIITWWCSWSWELLCFSWMLQQLPAVRRWELLPVAAGRKKINLPTDGCFGKWWLWNRYGQKIP